MATHVYPTVNNVTNHTSELRRQTTVGTCSQSGGYTVSSSSTLASKVEYRSATGFRTPGWRRMRNAGVILPMNSWDRLIVDVQSSLGSRQYCNISEGNRLYYYTNYYWYDGNFASPSGFVTKDWMSYVGTIDLQYFVQKAASAIYSSGWDAGTFLAEIGQLRRMLSGVGRKLSNLSEGKKADELYNLWLEGRYGWRTLMYDIRDLHEVLTSANERRRRYRESKGYTASGSWNSGIGTHTSGVKINFETNVSWTLNARGTVVADIDVPDFQFNPVTTAWEVTRLSFVVDWLLNVGQALEAASFLLMAKDYKACGGYRADFDVESDSWFVSNASGYSNGAHTGHVNGTVSVIKRLPMTVSAFPRIKLRLDGFKVIDLLALVRQRL